MLTFTVGDYYTDGKRLLEVVDADDRSPYVHLRDVCSSGGSVIAVIRGRMQSQMRRVEPATDEEMFGCADPLSSVPAS